MAAPRSGAGPFARALAIAGALVVLGTATMFTVGDDWPWQAERTAPPATIVELFRERVDTLRRGETVSELFARNGAGGFTLSASSPSELFDPRRLRPGLVFTFVTRVTDTVPARVSFRATPEQRVALHRVHDGWSARAVPVAWLAEPVAITGTMTSSLYEALDRGIPDSLFSGDDRIRMAWDLADVFAWQVDFTRDIREGDRFRVLVERLRSEDGEVRYGRVLAGDLEVAGERYTAFRWTGPDGRPGFYDDGGRSLRRAFLLAPLQFRRISSRMSSGRRHPILGTVRRHQGTDYAADPGTPVMAAGNGVVTERGWAGGYGNLVEIRHANGIVTRYGHLRGFARGIAPGIRVEQGDVVGYVGTTGLSSGPHLHYEFRVNGIPRDPRKTDLGTGEPVPSEALVAFNREQARLRGLLDTPRTFLAVGPGNGGVIHRPVGAGD